LLIFDDKKNGNPEGYRWKKIYLENFVLSFGKSA